MFDLFPPRTHLHPVIGGLYALFAVIGTLALLLTLLLVELELLTRPGFGRSWLDHAGVVAAFIGAIHVLLEARSSKPLSKSRWLIFLLAAALFAWQVWTAIHDPQSRTFFLALFAIGFTLLFLGRWLYTRNLPHT